MDFGKGSWPVTAHRNFQEDAKSAHTPTILFDSQNGFWLTHPALTTRDISPWTFRVYEATFTTEMSVQHMSHETDKAPENSREFAMTAKLSVQPEHLIFFQTVVSGHCPLLKSKILMFTQSDATS